jgi:hypothetical protein
MALKYINILQSKALKKFTQFGIFGLKTNHLATLFRNEYKKRIVKKVFVLHLYVPLHTLTSNINNYKQCNLTQYGTAQLLLIVVYFSKMHLQHSFIMRTITHITML